MTDINETAKAIIEMHADNEIVPIPHTEWLESQFNPGAGADIPYVRQVPFVDLQAMARLWLMKDEIEEMVEIGENEVEREGPLLSVRLAELDSPTK